MQKFNSIYLMMGEKCNFSCKYCLQHDLFNEPCTSKVDERIFDYFNNLEPLHGKKIRFMFWGGEPLLYWKTLKLFVEKLNKDKFNFSIVSNGELLNKEMVDFINNNNIQFTFSNDGANTDKFRNSNVLENSDFINHVNNIKAMTSATSVISAQNYKVDEIWNYISSKFDEEVYINYDFIMDTGSTPSDLTDFDFDAFDSYLLNLFNSFKSRIVTNQLTYNEAVFLKSLTQNLVDKYKVGSTPCGTTERTLNVDCMGNSFLCHNSGNKLGNVLDQDYSEILKVYNDNYNKYSTSAECSTCEANRYCKSGCVLVGEEARSRYYCKMKKIIFKHLDNLIKYVDGIGK